MNKMKLIPAALMMSSVAFAGSSMAHEGKSNYSFDNSFNSECSINLQNGVTVTPEFVKVFDERKKTVYRIEKNGEMSVEGESLDLDSSQQQAAADYANGIRQAVPKVVNIAGDAMELASKAVTEAMGGLFGQNSDVQVRVEDLMTQAKERISEKLSQSGDEFTISKNGMDEWDDVIDKELEQEIEKVVMNSMGSIFTLIGQAMSEGDGTFEERMEAFGEKMESWGEDLERSLEAQASKIEEQAEALCQQLKTIDKMETELQQQVPEFANFELLEVEKHRSSRRHHDDEGAE